MEALKGINWEVEVRERQLKYAPPEQREAARARLSWLRALIKSVEASPPQLQTAAKKSNRRRVRMGRG